MSTPKKGIVSVMDGKVQQLTTPTVTITPNTANRNVLDSVFIATTGLTRRAAIIKPKVSLHCGLLPDVRQLRQSFLNNGLNIRCSVRDLILAGFTSSG